jgi:tRNA A-37 threonylcarbamoyl transferase component Bud32
MANDVVYIIDKIREDNVIKYSCLEPYINLIVKKLGNGSLKFNQTEKLFKKQLLREEYLQLMAYLFYGCLCVTKETSTIAPVGELSLIGRKEEKFIKMNKWLTNLQGFGAISKQGDVYKGNFLGQEVVLKRPKKSFFLENTLKDYFNGIKCINNLRMECPMFAYTLGMLTIKGAPKTGNNEEPNDEIWLVTEYVKGKTLKEMLNVKHGRGEELSFKNFLDIFAQVLIALEIGQHKHKFCHYDLHTDNVIVVPNNGSYICHTFVYDVEVKSKYMPVLIDYGMSSISPEKDMYIGQHKIEKNGIYHYLFPGYDAYIFLLFCRDVAGHQIKAGIDHLFKFYGDIDHYNYVTTLKNNTGRQTPLLFLEFIRHNYPQLSLHFSERTAMSKSLLFRTPSMMMAEMFLNEDEKKTISSCFNNELDKGFIYYMLECTRNQLWFGQDKNMLTMSAYKKMILQDMSLLDKFLGLAPLLYPGEPRFPRKRRKAHPETLNPPSGISFTETFNKILPSDCQKNDKKFLQLDAHCERMDNLQCAVNLLFLIKQLKLCDYKPYKNWVDKFEGSRLFLLYKEKKPYFDRCQRLNLLNI